MSGHVGDLTPEQESALEIFKGRVEVFVKTKVEEEGYQLSDLEKKYLGMDSMHLRFLRARNWNMEAAFKQYVDTSIWRKTFQDIGVESVTEETVENELSKGKCFVFEYDKKNRSIIYIKPCLHIPSESDPKELDRFVVFMTELGSTLLRPGVENGLVIYDMNGFGLKNMDYEQVKSQIHILQSYYPESMGETLIVNSPWLFSACWRLIKGWIDPVAASKIKFVTTQELKEYIDEEKLLKEYGGTNEFVFRYETVEERKKTGYVPPWEMEWATNSNAIP